MSWPVMLETLSSTPSVGAVTVLVTSPNRLFAAATTSPLRTALPIGTRSVPATLAGSTESREATFRVCTFPGSSQRATTCSEVTASPMRTITVPLSGRRRSRDRVAESVTRSPGV
jgi:hypothetical protein